ncbi:MAG: hypothetical protein AAFX08_09950 [Pseudomonadota bacterium]
MKFVPANVHGVIDYAAAVGLIALPFILGFSGVALFLSAGAGAALFLYSLVTDYSTSVQKVLPFSAHLLIDFVAGVAFIAAPFLFGFQGLERLYFLIMGVVVCALVLVTDTAIEAEEA